METQQQNKNLSKVSGIIFSACMFIGAGIGMLCKATDIGAVIGMGVGFLAMAIIKFKNL